MAVFEGGLGRGIEGDCERKVLGGFDEGCVGGEVFEWDTAWERLGRNEERG